MDEHARNTDGHENEHNEHVQSTHKGMDEHGNGVNGHGIVYREAHSEVRNEHNAVDEHDNENSKALRRLACSLPGCSHSLDCEAFDCNTP